MIDIHKIILIGMKSSGKTTIGQVLAQETGLPFTDMDAQIEQLHLLQKNEELPFREIFKQYGGDYFRTMETAALEAMTSSEDAESFVLATGGGLPLAEENQAILKRLGTVIYLDVDSDVLLARIVRGGIPAFFPYPDDPEKSLDEILATRRPVYQGISQLTIPCRDETPDAVAKLIIDQLGELNREH
jgi:shikimate kinase